MKKIFKVFSLLKKGWIFLLVAALFSCSSLSLVLQKLLIDKSENSGVILPESAGASSDPQNFNTRHKELLDLILSRRNTVKGWNLQFLQFRYSSPEKDDSASVYLWAFIQSNSRFNTKFDSEKTRLQTEWRDKGLMLMQTWEPILAEFVQHRIGIQIAVEYKHKNYLRPAARLNLDTLFYQLSPEEVVSNAETANKIHQAISQKLK